MGTGASTQRPAAEEQGDDTPPGLVEAAKNGDENARQEFFEWMKNDVKYRVLFGLKTKFQGWPGAAQCIEAIELAVEAVRGNDVEMLQIFLNANVKFGELFDKDDHEVNPTIAGMSHKSWDCLALLAEEAIQYKESRVRMQWGLAKFVEEGDLETVQRLVQEVKIPGNCRSLCMAQLLAPSAVSKQLLELLSPTVSDLNEKCEVMESMNHIGWYGFTAIHAACMASHVSDDFLKFLINEKVDMSLWGQTSPSRSWGRATSKKKSKRLPLHFAAENLDLEDHVVLQIARAYPTALFETVGAKAGGLLPCQLAKDQRPRQSALEKEMYKHICQSYDDLKPEDRAGLLRVIRMACQFDSVRITDTSEELSRGRAIDLMSSQMKKLTDGQDEGSRQFHTEAKAFADANPRVDLGRESANKVEVKSGLIGPAELSSVIPVVPHKATMGEILKSEFWELLQLVSAAEKLNQDLVQVPRLEKLLALEISARLKWAAATAPDPERGSDTVRYALFIVAGLIAAGQSQEASDSDGEEEKAAPGESAKTSCNLADVAFEAAAEDLETIVASYCEDLQIPSAWKLLELLKQGLAGEHAFDCVFAGGDLVIKTVLEAEHPQFQWLVGLFQQTFLHIYTRDRHGEDVPKSLTLQSVEQVFNCGSWGEYARRRKVLGEEFHAQGPAWMEDLKTDACVRGEAPTWHLLDGVAANEHWLYHGTSLAGETGITEGDFRLNLAGSNAGTLYGNGVYLAEAVSKSDEYTEPHHDDLRSILVCLTSLGRVNYNDQKRPDGDELAASCKGGGFHSILGDREKIRGTYREIVVFNENQVYPAYICHYKRSTE